MTAVESIIHQLQKQKEILKNHFEAGKWNDDRVSEIDNCISICENAKQMEKEQLDKAYYKGQESKYIGGPSYCEQYYNETYGK